MVLTAGRRNYKRDVNGRCFLKSEKELCSFQRRKFEMCFESAFLEKATNIDTTRQDVR